MHLFSFFYNDSIGHLLCSITDNNGMLDRECFCLAKEKRSGCDSIEVLHCLQQSNLFSVIVYAAMQAHQYHYSVNVGIYRLDRELAGAASKGLQM
jgi:hypothetical protein